MADGTNVNQVLYPAIEPHSTGMLPVSNLHTIFWERSGNPSGEPIVVIHGGPGGGSQPSYRQYFNPAKFDIIQFDQRGCGRSTPYAELKDNNTYNLIADIESLRQHLGIGSWHVFGGSWGSTLSTIYAQNHPSNVRSLTLRGIFMCRKSELHWFYQEGASHVFPDAFEPYVNHIPEPERHELINAYYRRLTDESIVVRRAAAKEWTRWEMATSKLLPDAEYLEKAEDLDFAVAFARIECHYFINGIFVEEGHILNNVAKIVDIPTTIIQGRYDMVCPTISAWQLHKELPNSKLIIVKDAGHSMGEIGIAKELVNATDNL